MSTRDRIGNNKARVGTLVDGSLESKLHLILGSTTILNGSQLVYDLHQQVFRNGVLPLDLETGGPNDELLPEYKCNWYPGSITYGVVLDNDAPVYSSEDETNRQYLGTVQKFREGNNIEESIVRIYTVLDGINTNHTWQQKMNIYYKIRMHDGTIGYINSLLINKIVYKDC